MAEWTEELKKQVIAEYVAEEPTAETSSEIINEIVANHEDAGLTINGVRMVLVKAGVYKKKDETKKEGTTTKRINKAESIKKLGDIIRENDINVDDDLLGKLTGKQAVYLTSVIERIAND